MKKTVLMAVLLCSAAFAYAQSEKYESAMKSNIAQLDSLMTKGNFNELANNFIRIGDAEKTQWLPYYYAAYCYASEGLSEQDNSKKDAIADKANAQITKAEAILGKENSEIDVIKAMIETIQMTVDPQSRYMTYGALISDNIQKSESLDPTNPRPVLFEAQSKFFTPEQYGGGKDAAKVLFDKAKTLFDNFKPASDLSPNWGKTSLEYFLSQYK
jgi:hypothetical protein